MRLTFRNSGQPRTDAIALQQHVHLGYMTGAPEVHDLLPPRTQNSGAPHTTWLLRSRLGCSAPGETRVEDYALVRDVRIRRPCVGALGSTSWRSQGLNRKVATAQKSCWHYLAPTESPICCHVQKLEDDWPESIFPQVLIQPQRHLFTSLRRACLRAAMLSVYAHMRAPSHHPTFLSNCAARFLTKVVCASCIVPGCCAQVALCKLLRASALCKFCASALRQLLRASALRMCSAQVGLCKLLCACSVQVALRKCSEQVALRKGSAPVAPCKRFAHVLCASWSVQVALRKCFVQLLCASCSAQVALRT